jgi:hypothetical protein
MQRLRPSPWVRRLPTEGGLLLLDIASNSLLAYNHTARDVWNHLEHGGFEGRLATNLALQYNIAPATARKDVSALLEEWRALGVIVVDGVDLRPRAAIANDSTDWSSLPRPQWAANARFSIRSRAFALAVEPAHLTAFVRVLFRHLETPHAQPALRMEIRSTGNGANALLVDGVERLRTPDEGQLIGAVNHTILEFLHPGVSWLAMMHGGAVARNERAVAIAAPRGSGKTTLIAYLLSCGYDYLSDDLIALTSNGHIVPWPLPLSIKMGSWELLSTAYRELPSFPQYRTRRGEARQFVPPPNVWETGPVPLRTLVFPQYLAGAQTKLIRLSHLEALARLLGDKIWLGYPITEERLRDFLAWLERTPAYSLVNGNVAEAADCIAELK